MEVRAVQPEESLRRRSDWLLPRDDPKTILGWWSRNVLEHGGLMNLAILSVILTFLIFRTPWAGASLVFALLAFRFSRPPKDQLSPLLAEPAPEGRFTVNVAYLHSFDVLGKDQLAISVVDGWLYAEGVRSGFSISAADLLPPETGLDVVDSFRLREGGEIRFDGISHLARLAIREWYWSQTPVEGCPVLPPSRVHPERYTGAFSQFAFAAIVGIASFFVVSTDSLEWWVAGIQVAMQGVAMLSAYIGFKRIQQLKRIDSEVRHLPSSSVLKQVKEA